jgi:hypothetical protein
MDGCHEATAAAAVKVKVKSAACCCDVKDTVQRAASEYRTAAEKDSIMLAADSSRTHLSRASPV